MASFNIVAVQGEGEKEKAIHSPGVEGLQVWLEGCRGEAPRCGVSAFDISVDSVEKVFMDKEWLPDMSFKWDDVENLLEALGLPEVKEVPEFKEEKELPEFKEEKELPEFKEEVVAPDISEWVDRMRDRMMTNEFPLLHPTDLRREEEQRDAEQVNWLFQMMIGYEETSIEVIYGNFESHI